MAEPSPEPAAQPHNGHGTIAVREKRTPAVLSWDQEFQKLVKLTLLKPKNREATGAELAMFAEQVQRTGLDPFFKQIYGIYRYDSRVGDEVMQVQAGIDGFRLIAERTGKYEGQTPAQWCGKDGAWTDVWTQDGKPFAARVGVYKKGRREPTYAVAHWTEYAQSSGKWKDMPANMIAKCAEALALRKAFPAELSGLYTPEEMEQAANDASLSQGRGDGKPLGIPLGDDVEAVIARANALGVAAFGEEARGTLEMQIVDKDGHVDEARAADWVKRATAELDAIPPDAVVVTPDGPVIVEHKTDADRDEPIPADMAARQKEAYEEVTGQPVAAAQGIAELRQRGEQLLADADALDDVDPAAAADKRDEWEAVAAQIEAMENADQMALGGF